MMKCQKCGVDCNSEWAVCPKCGFPLAAKQHRQYKAVQIRASSVLNKIGAEDIQKTLNDEAISGWIFDQCITSEYFTKLNMIILVFYKNLDKGDE